MAVVPGIPHSKGQVHRSQIAPRGQTPMGDPLQQGNMTRGISIRRRRKTRCKEGRTSVIHWHMTVITDEDRPKRQGGTGEFS